MGRIRDTFTAFWDSRKARYQAAALKERAEIERHSRRLSLSRKEYKSAGELVELQLLESAESVWGGLDRINLLKGELDRIMDFQRGGIGLGGAGVTDHGGKRGADFPFFNSETELATRRDTSRIVLGTNDNAMGLLGGNRRYTLGSGATVRVTGRTSADSDAAAKAQAVIDGFIRDNNFAFKQREYFTRTSRDGEGIFRLFPQDDGTTKARFVWPEQIKQPSSDRLPEGLAGEVSDEDCSFGRITDPEDVETTLAWAVYPTQGPNTTEPDIVPAAEVVYHGPNADTGVKRSLPDFCLATADALEAAGRLAIAMGEGSVTQASIAFIRQHNAAMPKTTIQAFAAADASYTRPNPYTGGDQNVRKFDPNTIIDTNTNTEFLASPYNAGITSHLEVFQALVRRAHARWNAPEWLGSSYSQQVNFASSLTAESPYILTVLEMQEYYAATFRSLFEKVLAVAAAREKLPDDVLERVEIKVTFPNPQSRDRYQESQRAAIRLANGTTSPQRVAEEDGDEWDKIVEERKQAQAAGWVPPGAIKEEPRAETPVLPAATDPAA